MGFILFLVGCFFVILGAFQAFSFSRKLRLFGGASLSFSLYEGIFSFGSFYGAGAFWGSIFFFLFVWESFRFVFFMGLELFGEHFHLNSFSLTFSFRSFLWDIIDNVRGNAILQANAFWGIFFFVWENFFIGVFLWWLNLFWGSIIDFNSFSLTFSFRSFLWDLI